MRKTAGVRRRVKWTRMIPNGEAPRCNDRAAGSLFGYQMLGWLRLGRGGLRNRERQPGIPARRTIGRIEFAVGLKPRKPFMPLSKRLSLKLRKVLAGECRG